MGPESSTVVQARQGSAKLTLWWPGWLCTLPLLCGTIGLDDTQVSLPALLMLRSVPTYYRYMDLSLAANILYVWFGWWCLFVFFFFCNVRSLNPGPCMY